MKKKIIYTDEPLGDLQVVEDFLPPSDQLIFKEKRIKVTDCKRSERSQSVDYDPGPFTNVYHTPLGRDLWNFLNQDSTIRQMQNASDNGRPAVEPLEGLLPDQLRRPLVGHEDVDRLKQMIGHMVRQVLELERNGYEHLRYGAQVQGRLFTSGSLYRRRE